MKLTASSPSDGLRIDEVVRIHARDDERRGFAVTCGDQHLVAVATFQGRQGSDSPTSLACPHGQRRWRPVGRQAAESAEPASTAPRSPARRHPGQPGAGSLSES